MGAGAAGGVPFGLASALDAEIISGFNWISRLIGLEDKIKACDIVISAEGRLDRQSLSGKATGELARLCSLYGKRLWLLPALVEEGITAQPPLIERIIPTCPPDRKAGLEDVSDTAYRAAAAE
jgi:glycerate kinase